MNRIGINLLWMVPGVVGGSETYLVRLLKGLSERNKDFEYTLFALPQFQGAYPDIAQAFEVAYAPVTGQWKSFRVAGENTWLAVQCRTRKIALVHHAGGIVPLMGRSRPVLTVHDLQYLYYPEYFSRSKLNYLRVMVPRSAESARVILTPSEYTRRSVIERLNMDPSVVISVPHGIAPREVPETPLDVRSHFGLAEHYFLYPAAPYPHKNHLMLLDAFARLLKIHPDVDLVFTGAKAALEWKIARDMDSRIVQEITERGLGSRVKRLGYVSSAELDALYVGATAVTFPSRFEGFGAPVLEAMSRGCPVIAADATALPEVAGEAARLVSPDNSDHWCTVMCDVIDDDELRAQLAKAGRERAELFTWDRSAEILENAYRHALATTL